jgi:hypothetical protein
MSNNKMTWAVKIIARTAIGLSGQFNSHKKIIAQKHSQAPVIKAAAKKDKATMLIKLFLARIASYSMQETKWVMILNKAGMVMTRLSNTLLHVFDFFAAMFAIPA